jgi:hypothetical protein
MARTSIESCQMLENRAKNSDSGGNALADTIGFALEHPTMERFQGRHQYWSRSIYVVRFMLFTGFGLP